MVKRIVDTAQWNDPWFRQLTGRHKLAFKFISETSDQCGVVRIDVEYWQFMLKFELKLDEFLKAIEERVVRLKNGDLWLPHVVKEQYGPLSESCRPHRPVIEFLRRESLLQHPSVVFAKPVSISATQVAEALSKPFGNPLERVSEKKEKTPRKKFIPPTVEEIAAYCEQRKNGLDPEAIFNHYAANGWVQGRGAKPIKDWQAAVRTCEKLEKDRKKIAVGSVAPLSEQIQEAKKELQSQDTKRPPLAREVAV